MRQSHRRSLATSLGMFLGTLSVLLVPRAALAQAPQGDLVYTCGWVAEFSLPYYGVGIDLQMFDDQWRQLAEDVNGGLEWAHAEVWADVRARSMQQTVYAREDVYWYDPIWGGGEEVGTGPNVPSETPSPWWIWIGWAEDSAVLPGAGPDYVSLWTSAFIQYNWIGDPIIPGLIYNGNDRQFDLYGDHKIAISADAWNTAIHNGDWRNGPSVNVGITEAYDLATSLDNYPWAGGQLTQEAKDDWEWGGDKKLAWGWADPGGSGCDSFDRLGDSVRPWTSSARIRCAGYGSNPLVPWPFSAFAPDLNWDFTLVLTFGDDHLAYSLEGDCDGFPSYELYLNGQPVLEQPDNGDIWSLEPPMDVHFSKQGDIYYFG